MRASVITLSFFIIGIFIGKFNFLPAQFNTTILSEYALFLLMFLVGVSMGGDRKTWSSLRELDFKIVFVPLTVIVGSLLGASIGALLIPDINLKEALSVGAGFGYYSISSILITKFYSETLGVVALLSNMIRELITLLFSPFMKKYFGKLAPIAAGGATSMDITLPIITLVSGKDYALISVFSGVVLTALVPLLVTFIITR